MLEPTLVEFLPPSNHVNVAALSRLFARATTSYKYLFFLSLLDILQAQNFDVTTAIRLRDITVEMLLYAWHPHVVAGLSLGSQDRLADKLNTLYTSPSWPRSLGYDREALRQAIATQDIRDTVAYLKRYVPFRLLIPFVEEEIKQRGISRAEGNRLEVAMPSLAAELFNSHKPLYHFDADTPAKCRAVLVHPAWGRYIATHKLLLRDWALWTWLDYMQRRNPDVTGIVYKLGIWHKMASDSER